VFFDCLEQYGWAERELGADARAHKPGGSGRGGGQESRDCGEGACFSCARANENCRKMGADTAQAMVQGSRQASVLLPVCKYVERSGERKACCLPVHARSHKRGFTAVACMANHQWVWCEACCDCSSGGAGCTNPLHWMERDSFDTGKVSALPFSRSLPIWWKGGKKRRRHEKRTFGHGAISFP
jgi:hypothetical protein